MRGIKDRIGVLWIWIGMHLRRIGLLHELRKHVRMMQGHLEPVAGSVRKLWSRYIGRRSRNQIDILVRSDRLGRRLRPVSAAEREVGTSSSSVSVDTPAPKLRVVEVGSHPGCEVVSK